MGTGFLKHRTRVSYQSTEIMPWWFTISILPALKLSSSAHCLFFFFFPRDQRKKGRQIYPSCKFSRKRRRRNQFSEVQETVWQLWSWKAHPHNLMAFWEPWNLFILHHQLLCCQDSKNLLVLLSLKRGTFGQQQFCPALFIYKISTCKKFW